jgi:tetrahydromethanopterin S-methyltransferase subunit G
MEPPITVVVFVQLLALPAEHWHTDRSPGSHQSRLATRSANTTRSKVRARVEHVFGDQKNAMGAEIGRTIGIVRARCEIGMTNVVYNMRRFIILARMAEVASAA